MKKFLAALLTGTMAIAMLAGCGGASAADSSNQSEAQADEASGTESSEAGGTSGTEEADGVSNGFTTVNDGVLTMATNAYFPPYEYYEGDKVVGIDAEIAEAIAEKLGLELKIEDMEFDSILIAVQNGKADMGLAGISVTEDRLKSVNFSDSYATGIQSIIVTEDSEIAGVDDLTGKKIGVQLATTGDIYAKDDFGEENVEEYNKGADAVMALKQGKVDAVIIDNQPAKSFIESTEGLKLLDTDYVSEDYAAALSKDNDALTEAVNGAVKELKEDGMIQEILDKYIK